MRTDNWPSAHSAGRTRTTKDDLCMGMPRERGAVKGRGESTVYGRLPSPPSLPASVPAQVFPRDDDVRNSIFRGSDARYRADVLHKRSMVVHSLISTDDNHDIEDRRRLASPAHGKTMPRPTMPPTPAPSGDLLGREGKRSSALEQSFTLPPPAMVTKADVRPNGGRSRRILAPSREPEAPLSPTSPVAEDVPTRRQGAGGRPAREKENFTLPPPPARSRKIIQMKPRPHTATASTGAGAKAKSAAGAPSAAGASGAGRGKQPSTTSAAGRKVARKTAHSLIERRRRSKMNEEFGMLRQMIPACRDQEMHKLAILQASIEYLRYLEQCVTDLDAKARQSPAEAAAAAPAAPAAAAAAGSAHAAIVVAAHPHGSPSSDGDASDATDDQDQDHPTEDHPMSGTASPSSTERPQPNVVPSPLASPITCGPLAPSPTAITSPNLPTETPIGRALCSSTSMLQTVPAGWSGGRDVDQEATEALLLLNTDRRRSMTRGMSVKDLLTP
ncbi:MAG: hypothetical protein M1815_004561 [Lichina confinis]|nr:MAG: hypothetical protein M1815_004561 [Lichina confinis]